MTHVMSVGSAMVENWYSFFYCHNDLRCNLNSLPTLLWLNGIYKLFYIIQPSISRYRMEYGTIKCALIHEHFVLTINLLRILHTHVGLKW